MKNFILVFVLLSSFVHVATAESPNSQKSVRVTYKSIPLKLVIPEGQCIFEPLTPSEKNRFQAYQIFTENLKQHILILTQECSKSPNRMTSRWSVLLRPPIGISRQELISVCERATNLPPSSISQTSNEISNVISNATGKSIQISPNIRAFSDAYGCYTEVVAKSTEGISLKTVSGMTVINGIPLSFSYVMPSKLNTDRLYLVSNIVREAVKLNSLYEGTQK